MSKKVAAGADDASAEPSLAEELARLETIVRRLESEELDLDAALVLFEEGVRRLRVARERLGAAELKVQQVLTDVGSELGVRDLDV